MFDGFEMACFMTGLLLGFCICTFALALGIRMMGED
jgi:Na+(H+)/acetate symporter ActP